MTRPVYSKDLSRGQFLTFNEKPNILHSRVHQVHGADVITLQASETQDLMSEADGLGYSDHQYAVPMIIVTADCVPVVIEGENGAYFLHMGWRSIAADILKHPDIPKIKPTSLFIGPHIRRENYEVSAEFTQHFPNSDNFHHENDKITFDLAGEVKARALSLWPSVAIEESHTCTFDHDELHSVRKEPTKQRNWNLYLPQGWSYDTK